MAFLKLPQTSFFTIFLMCAVSFTGNAMAMPSPFEAPRLRLGAWQSLAQCEAPKANYWANALQSFGKEEVLLYRLSWIQILSEKSTSSKPAVLGDSASTGQQDAWKWKWDGELWRDTQEGLGEGSCLKDKSVTAWDQLPSEVTSRLLLPALAEYSYYSETTRQILRQYALHAALRGKKLVLKPTQSFKSQAEACEWKSLLAVHNSKISKNELQTLLKECPSTEISPLDALVQVALGDRFLEEANPPSAFDSFLGAAGVLGNQELPVALHYRLAVSSALADSKDDRPLRLLRLGLEKDPNEVHRVTMRNLMCERIEHLTAVQGLQAVEVVFSGGKLVPELLQLVEACDSSKLNEVAALFTQKSSDTHSKLEMSAALLKRSIQAQKFTQAEVWVRNISHAAHDFPMVASQLFWKSLSVAPNPKALKSLIHLYRSKVEWRKSDEIHYARWEREVSQLAKTKLKPKAPTLIAEKALLLEKLHAASELSLPVALIPPPMDWSSVPSGEVSFLVKFREKLQITASGRLKGVGK